MTAPLDECPDGLGVACVAPHNPESEPTGYGACSFARPDPTSVALEVGE
jgi:hypothetical protein